MMRQKMKHYSVKYQRKSKWCYESWQDNHHFLFQIFLDVFPDALPVLYFLIKYLYFIRRKNKYVKQFSSLSMNKMSKYIHYFAHKTSSALRGPIYVFKTFIWAYVIVKQNPFFAINSKVIFSNYSVYCMYSRVRGGLDKMC